MDVLIIDDHPIILETLSVMVHRAIPGATVHVQSELGAAIAQGMGLADFRLALLDKDVGLTSVRAVGSRDDEDSTGPVRFKPDSAARLPASAEPGPPLVSPSASAGSEPLPLPGVIARATLDRSHWLAYGYEDAEIPVLLATGRFFAPSREGANPVVFKGPDLIVSGFAWPNNSERLLDRSVYAAVESRGRGHVILFADDPTFRAVTQGVWKLLGNAILMGPGR